MQKKRIFITGIAGFIGFHLALRLSNEGYEVHGIDNFNDYYSPHLKKRRAELLKENGVEITNGSIENREILYASLGCMPTHIVHLAAQAGVRFSYTNPDSYIQSNLLGFYSLLSWNKDHRLPFIFASSSSVYGNSAKPPFKEDSMTDTPSSLYAATKKCNELLAYSYHHQFGIPCMGFRFFTVYGPWGRPDMAYFSFAEKIRKQIPITLYNEGSLQRDFTYIDDIIEGIVAALSVSFNFEIVNLGNQEPCCVMDLVSHLEKLSQQKAIIEYAPKPITDVDITAADITKARRLLGFEPQTSLEEGLTKFYDWYHDVYLREESFV